MRTVLQRFTELRPEQCNESSRVRLGAIFNGPVVQRNGCLPVTETTAVRLCVGSPCSYSLRDESIGLRNRKSGFESQYEYHATGGGLPRKPPKPPFLSSNLSRCTLTQVSEYGYPGGPLSNLATEWLGSTVEDTADNLLRKAGSD